MSTGRVLRFLAVVMLVALLLSCDKLNSAMKSVNGKVAGIAMNEAGRGRGYITVKLLPDGGGDELMELADDAGNFMFDTVPPGKYVMHAYNGGGSEIPSDTPTVNVGPGRTMNQNITLKDAPAQASQ